MKIFSNLKSKSKGLISLILGCAIVAQMFGSMSASAATGPRWNFLSGDRELLSGANKTTAAADWSDPVSGTAGDTFAGMVYYHNGYLNTTATNVRVKVNMPTVTTNKVAVLTASISADNAPTVTDTILEDGTLIGKSGLTVNLNEDAKLSVVPGSVEWLPNFVTSGATHVLPNGQTGDTLTTSGINIGSIQGCWEYAGYVRFLFKTEKVAQSNVTVAKTVRNVTLGETSFVESNFAKPGDILEYQVVVKNTGAGTADNLYLTDAIPAGTTYVAGSTTKNGTASTDGISGDGISIGSLAFNQSMVVKFRVKVGQSVKNGAVLLNTVSLYVNKEVKTDTAKTTVKFNVTTPVVGGTLPVTGGESVIFTLLALATAGLYGIYRKSRKVLIAKTW